MNIMRIWKLISEARTSTPAPHVCVVGAGPDFARIVGELSAGARDAAGGVSSGVDAIAPADFPRDRELAGRWDIVVLVADSFPADDAVPVVHAARRAGSKVIGLVETPGDDWVRTAGLFSDEVARGTGRVPAAKPTLESCIIDAAGDGAGSLAAELPVLRRTYADHIVLTNATQNGVIGAAFIIPGADMPAMTANQIRMILKIAHAYGEELGLDRALEILSVVGTGFVLRTLARQALDFIPGLGWAVKGAVGFTGTVAMGQVAITYFEAGAPLRTSRMQRINRQLERLTERIPGPVRRMASR